MIGPRLRLTTKQIYQDQSNQSRGGQTNHNFGLAWDVGIFQSGQYMDDSPVYAQVVGIGK